jgi:hypothetical protein
MPSLATQPGHRLRHEERSHERDAEAVATPHRAGRRRPYGPVTQTRDLAHYARNDELAQARREGRAVKALCGTLFHPHADPHSLPVCVVCRDLAGA